MISTSRMSGTLLIRLVPGARRVAAMSFSTEFFAPVRRTSPVSGLPPVTRKTSTGASYEQAAAPRVAVPLASVVHRVRGCSRVHSW